MMMMMMMMMMMTDDDDDGNVRKNRRSLQLCMQLYYVAELAQGEKEQSDWFPEWSEFCYTDQ